MDRDLLNYRWSSRNGKVTLLDKKKNNSFTIKMDKADSFVRAYVSFKNNQRILEKENIRQVYKTKTDKLRSEIKRLRNVIKEMRNAKQKKNAEKLNNVVAAKIRPAV